MTRGHHHRTPRFPRLAMAASVALALAACGGGGGTSSTTTAQPVNGSVTVGVTDAPSTDFQNVWVTISEIDFHADPNAAPTDGAWLKYPLAAPETVNLAALNNGSFQDVFPNLQLPVGTYKQVRLVLVSDDAALTASASSQGLAYNDQVDYLDATNTMQHAPLELVGPRQGIQVFGTFDVTSAAPLHLVFDFDLDDDVVSFPDELSGKPAFTLRPHTLRYFDMSNVGAITGQVDPSKLATSATGNAATGAYNLIVKAEVVDSTGSTHQIVRLTGADPTTGKFTLYPLPMGGQATRNFDVVIRGRQMDTIIVKGVPVTAGSTPASGATAISNAPIPVNNDTDYTMSIATSTPASPTSTWVDFYQTLPLSGELPYEIRFREVNPFTGLINAGFPLSAGNLWYATYSSSGTLPTPQSATPNQGTGTFDMIGAAAQYVPSTAVSVSPAAATPNGPQLVLNSALAAASGTITLNYTGTAGEYDNAQFVVARYGDIVDTIPVPSTVLSSGTGTITMGNLPAGTTATPDTGAFYYGYLRVWNSTHAGTRVKVVPILNFADFRTANAATFSVTVP
ncbi:MAG TPA: DUF4382 domain-containing protein [Burkholderiaceae bacterium]|nr:DUF4382 domain-containing protein [Burkholderiaceae bacterium]